MELRQLAYVVAVAEEGSFTRAAEREHVAQPAVSAQVRRLEAELGQPLFARGPGPVTLTAAGEAVLPFARAALASAAGVRTAVDELAGLLRGRVAVGIVPSIEHRLAGVLAAFHAAHPGVEITLAEDTSDALIDGVRTGRLDFAVAGVAGAGPPDLPARRRPGPPPAHPGRGDRHRRAARRRRRARPSAGRAEDRHAARAARRGAHRAARRGGRTARAPTRLRAPRPRPASRARGGRPARPPRARAARARRGDRARGGARGPARPRAETGAALAARARLAYGRRSEPDRARAARAHPRRAGGALRRRPLTDP